ncbi:hypothetical protein Pst134EA_022663 [Puccinia striiformis f. sp. tritici]|uniref:hypothetical protein n=1 Tax=Puccinia striiformis f. sp. tritici TaxID=168172 RepID=UPI0020073D18|nr:hypothetical protein Pst134EA_022663 [Puccinia striiformis f. sp. tritici]KAH9455187.1 hypothetical protein Pst134EA_022663 [Puccinia striiformis f. sp. tritici]
MACASSTAPVLQALRALARRFKQMRFDVRHGEKKEELTEDELAQKNKLLDELQSSLLPSIKQQLNTLSAVLDLPRGFREFPQPDVDLTLETLTNLNQTMKKSSINIRLATLETSVPTDTHDHHLGRCKTFRGRLLREDIARIEYNLYGLYLTYMKRVESWNHTSDFPQDPVWDADPPHRAPTPRGETAKCLDSTPDDLYTTYTIVRDRSAI